MKWRKLEKFEDVREEAALMGIAQALSTKIPIEKNLFGITPLKNSIESEIRNN